MAYRIHNAWNFAHPDFYQTITGSGLNIAATGKIAMVSGPASIRQSIILLLSTMPGERIMHPSYGCNLQKLAFLPNDATTHGLAIHYVRTALDQWEPRIDVVNIDATTNTDNVTIMDITLIYKIRPFQETEELLVAFHLMEA